MTAKTYTFAAKQVGPIIYGLSIGYKLTFSGSGTVELTSDIEGAENNLAVWTAITPDSDGVIMITGQSVAARVTATASSTLTVEDGTIADLAQYQQGLSLGTAGKTVTAEADPDAGLIRKTISGIDLPEGIAWQLPRFVNALKQVKSGTRNAKILCLGDSTTAGLFSSGSNYTNCKVGGYPAALALSLSQRWDVYTGSTIGDTASNTANFLAYDPRWTFDAGWASNGVITLGGLTIKSTTANAIAAFTPSQPFDTIDIYYVQNAGYGSFALNVDGGATLGAVVNAAGTLSMQKVTRTCALGSHTLNIVNQNTSQVLIVGVSTYNSSVKGLEIISAGTGGMTTTGAAANTNVWDPSYVSGSLGILSQIQPDLTIVSLGINDWLNSITPATHTSNMATIIAALQNYSDVVLMTPFPSSSGVTALATQLGIVAANRQAAINNGCPIIDVNAQFGGYAFAQGTLGYYLPTNDTKHPGATGYAIAASAINTALAI